MYLLGIYLIDGGKYLFLVELKFLGKSGIFNFRFVTLRTTTLLLVLHKVAMNLSLAIRRKVLMGFVEGK